MLLSARRTVIATCAIVIFLAIATYESVRLYYIPNPLDRFQELLPGKNVSIVAEHDASPWDENITYAYVQYATDLDYLCNAVINFNRLNAYGAKHDKVMIIPEQWTAKDSSSREAKAIKKLQDTYPWITLRPKRVVSTAKGDATWRDSLTKFHAFSLTEYSRVLAFDSDALVLNTMDEWFRAPRSAIAVPRAYWLTESEKRSIAKHILGSHVMLIEPGKRLYRQVMNAALESGQFDMEVINNLFKDTAMILPHRRLALLTGEFRAKDHSKYLAPDIDVEWNAMGEVSNAYLVHFSDWPLPKPWKHRTKKQWEDALPECPDDDVATADKPRCAERFMWTGFYEDYAMYKDNYCEFLE